MKRYAIIVAGGVGSRFGTTLPKQFVALGGKPMLMRTIDAFYRYDALMEIIVALPSEYVSLWLDLCTTHKFVTPHRVAEGGTTRFESVRNALF